MPDLWRLAPDQHEKGRDMTAPERSLKQRRDALERANEVRVKRAQWKRDAKAGCESIHAVLLDPPAFMETAKVFDVLLAVPKYGRVKVNKVLTQCRVSPSKTIGGLSQRQRDELVSLLRRGLPARVVPPAASSCVHLHDEAKHGALCGTHALRPRYTERLSAVTCLTCAALSRKTIRTVVADERIRQALGVIT